MPRIRSQRPALAVNILFYVAISILALVVVFPILAIVSNSFKTYGEYMQNPVSLPAHPVLESYAKAWQGGAFAVHLRNTLFVVVSSVAGILVISGLAAYGIARLEELTKLGTVIYAFLVAGIMVPPTTVIVRVFFLLQTLHLLNALSGVIFCYLGAYLSVPVLLMTGFFKSVPKELFDAIEIDGCGPVRTFLNIVVPLSRPVISTVVILLSVWLWNEFLFPYILISADRKMTVQVALQNMATMFWTDVPTMFASVMFTILPLIAVYLILQRQFIEGLSRGALKG
jgi:raffinose/stachyose/melibiose transport system permease protein